MYEAFIRLQRTFMITDKNLTHFYTKGARIITYEYVHNALHCVHNALYRYYQQCYDIFKTWHINISLL